MLTDSQECFWGVELSKENPTYTWNFEEEDDDEEYMVHTLFLKTAVLGASAVKGERNLIQIETKNFEKKDVKQALVSLTRGQSDMCSLDVSFAMATPVTFRLIEGAGPIALGGQQLVEFPPDEEINAQDESALETTMDEDLTEDDSPKKSRKRKADSGAGKKTGKKGKLEGGGSSADDSVEDDEEEDDDEDEVDEEDEDEEDEDEDDAEEMEEEEESTKKAKGTKGKKGGPKQTKTTPKKAAKKTTKKGKK